MTVDQGTDTGRYQGLVALEGKDLEHAAHEYFLRSEQIPTRVRLAVGEELRAGDGWRHASAGAPAAFCCSSCRSRRSARALPDLDPGDAPEGTAAHTVAEDDAWVEGRSLVATVEDVELIDPAVSAERCSIACSTSAACASSAAATLAAQCSCSRDKRRANMLGASRRTTATTWSRTARSR